MKKSNIDQCFCLFVFAEFIMCYLLQSNFEKIMFTKICLLYSFLFRFRKGFKYVFRWLPCIEFHSGDNLARLGTTSVRMSVSEGTRFERNGSMMHTMIESLEESSYVAPATHKGFHSLRNSSRDNGYSERFANTYTDSSAVWIISPFNSKYQILLTPFKSSLMIISINWSLLYTKGWVVNF